MAAVVKRYWRAVSLLCSAGLVVVGLYVHFSTGAASPEAGASGTPDGTTGASGATGASSGSDASSVEAMAYVLEYDTLQGIRQKFCLSDEDLAAYGCEAGQAANLITMLRQWYVANGAGLATANGDFFAKRGELADVAQRIGIGSRDERLLDRQAQLQQEVAALQGHLQQIEQGVKQQIAQPLSAPQQILWQAAMTNGGLPTAYRYMPNLSEQDRAALHRWLRNEQLTAIAASNAGRDGTSATGGATTPGNGAGTTPATTSANTAGNGTGTTAGNTPATTAVAQLIQAGETEQQTRRTLMAKNLPAIREATATILPPPPVDPLTGDGASGGSYDPFQASQSSLVQPNSTIPVTLNEFGFQGKMHDQVTGLVHDRGRMYSPAIQRPMQRDPAGYVDGMNLYQSRQSNPINRRDWTGLKSECYCGPDVTDFLADLINEASKWRAKQGTISRAQGLTWLQANGMNLDWFSSGGPYKTQNCPSGKQCQNTYWLCDECVHDHWIGNFMYGYLGRLLHLPDWMMDKAGDKVQGPGIGDDPNVNYSDPPWDTAGYGLARITYDELANFKGKRDLCTILKSDMNLWNTANNTAVRPTPSIFIAFDTTPNWPSPHALGYKNCTKCPEDLPAAARNTVPGGKFGNAFPDIK